MNVKQMIKFLSQFRPNTKIEHGNFIYYKTSRVFEKNYHFHFDFDTNKPCKGEDKKDKTKIKNITFWCSE